MQAVQASALGPVAFRSCCAGGRGAGVHARGGACVCVCVPLRLCVCAQDGGRSTCYGAPPRPSLLRLPGSSTRVAPFSFNAYNRPRPNQPKQEEPWDHTTCLCDPVHAEPAVVVAHGGAPHVLRGQAAPRWVHHREVGRHHGELRREGLGSGQGWGGMPH